MYANPTWKPIQGGRKPRIMHESCTVTAPFLDKLQAASAWHLYLNHSSIPPLNPHLRSSFERKVSAIWKLLRERLNHVVMSHVKIKLMQMLI